MPANYTNGSYGTYGGGACPRCGGIHPAACQIRETARTRFIAMRLLAEIGMVPTEAREARIWWDHKKKNEPANEFRPRQLAALRSQGMGQLEDVHREVLAYVSGPYVDDDFVPLVPTRANLLAYVRNATGRKDKVIDNAIKDLLKMQLIAITNEVIHPYGRLPKMTATGKAFMIGVLAVDKQILVAASGSNSGRLTRPVDALRRQYQITVCPERSNVGANKTVAGKPIAGDEYAGTLRDNAPGTCAAPRLIQHAAEDPELLAKRAQWEMTEVWYDPSMSSDDTYIHGLSAKHCNTCAVLVPLLLCPN